MIIVIVGVLGFLAGIFFDIVSLKRRGHLRALSWLVVSVLMGYAHIALGLSPDKFWLPLPLVWVGWFCLIMGGFLLFYSLFLEIPFSKTYLQDGSHQELFQEGTYALTRHPGVLWYALMLVGLVLASRSSLALIAAPVWMSMEVLWVWVEDRFIFEEVIEGYRDYKRKTPMLIPTRESMGRCWDTLALRRMFAHHRAQDENEKG